MHELSLAEGLLQIIGDAAVRDKFSQVTTVWLEIGQLSSVETQALAFCFDAVARGTVAQGARLEILTPPGLGWCEDCLAPLTMAEIFDTCPQCDGYHVRVTGGTEMRVKELEVL